MSLRVRKFLFNFLPAIIWMGAIFYVSSFPTGKASEIQVQDFLLKKTAHVIEYAILAALLFRGFYGSGVGILKALLITFVCSVLFAASDEFHQMFVPGRGPHIRDVFIDATGASLSLGTIWYILQNQQKKLRQQDVI